MKLFEVDEKTGLAIPSAEARTINEFAKIIKRSRPCEGDGDGRKKIMNIKELAFIHFMGVYDSRFKNINKVEDKIKAVQKLVGLPIDWIPDELIMEGLKVYEETQITESTPLVNSMIKATNAVIAYLDGINEAIISNANKFKPKDITEIQECMENVPKMQEALKRAKDMQRKEQDTLASGRKGRPLGTFEIDAPSI